MTYEESLLYLNNLCKFGINLGLTRIEKLLEFMQQPQRKFKTVHVTGTNGKGSTTAMLASILKAAGIKTGMYTSPHLIEYTERMMINGEEISQEKFAEIMDYTSQFVEKIAEEGLGHPTEFEVLTAAAFHYFAECGVEYAIIEVGLGGLLDSTNVILPEVSLITNVTLDHIDKCGSTIVEIARHKAGIIKPGIPVITAAKEQALAIIQQAAEEKAAPLYVYGKDFSAQFWGAAGHLQNVKVETQQDGKLGPLQVNLLGYHQVDNCAVAVMAAMLLAKKDKRITVSALHSGLQQVYWPGRFEVIPGKPVIIIDGAHNQDGAKGLRSNLDGFYEDKEIVFLLGILRDKDVKAIVKTLIYPSDQVVVVSPISERAGEPEVIAQEIQAKHVETAASIAEGLKRACMLAGENGIVCIAGSLYLVGTARQMVAQL